MWAVAGLTGLGLLATLAHVITGPVVDKAGPLLDGELEPANAWGREIGAAAASSVAALTPDG